MSIFSSDIFFLPKQMSIEICLCRIGNPNETGVCPKTENNPLNEFEIK